MARDHLQYIFALMDSFTFHKISIQFLLDMIMGMVLILTDTLTLILANVVSTSNINVPGMWMFRLDEEDIASGRCINQDAGVY